MLCTYIISSYQNRTPPIRSYRPTPDQQPTQTYPQLLLIPAYHTITPNIPTLLVPVTAVGIDIIAVNYVVCLMLNVRVCDVTKSFSLSLSHSLSLTHKWSRPNQCLPIIYHAYLFSQLIFHNRSDCYKQELETRPANINGHE